MTTYTGAISTFTPTNQSFWGRSETFSEPDDKYNSFKTIVIDDIKDISIDTPKLSPVFKTLNFLGLAPTTRITDDVAKKTMISLVLASFVTIWVNNAFIYVTYFITALMTFLLELIIDRTTDLLNKVKTLISEIIIAGFTVVVAENVLSSVFQIPFLKNSLPIVYFALSFLILGHVFQMFKLLLPYTNFAKSKTLCNLILSIKEGWETFSGSFVKRMTEPDNKKETI